MIKLRRIIMQFEAYLWDELDEEIQICQVELDYYEEGFVGDNENPPEPEVFEFTVGDRGGERCVGQSYDIYNEYDYLVSECKRLILEWSDGDCDEIMMECDL